MQSCVLQGGPAAEDGRGPGAVCPAFSPHINETHKLKSILLTRIGSSSKLSAQPKEVKNITDGELRRRLNF